jgi:hypothetical protein
MNIESVASPLSVHLLSDLTTDKNQMTLILCPIRRAYINTAPVGAGFHACPRHTIA